MAKSIIQAEKECFMCGSQQWLEDHHIFNNYANRKLSEKYGLKVWLCHYCHNERPNGVHHNAERMRYLKATGQKKAMEHYGWTVDEFRKIFGKNYL